MSLLPSTITKTLSGVLTAKDLEGISKIGFGAFRGCPNLIAVALPDTITTIEQYAFYDCPNLQTIYMGKNCFTSLTLYTFSATLSNIDMSDISENSVMNTLYFAETEWYNSLPTESMICIANDKMLFTNTISKPSEGFEIPSTVTVLGGLSCQKYGDTSDSNFTSFVIPDTIENIQGSVFEGQPLATITVGSSVRKIGSYLTPSTTTTTLIFRQPAGMYIELPTAGNGSGMAYDKDSRAISVYTDNEYIKNYDWATDNVTVTIYPLSQAPV